MNRGATPQAGRKPACKTLMFVDRYAIEPDTAGMRFLGSNPPNPDFGRTLWAQGIRLKTRVVAIFQPDVIMVGGAIRRGCEVTGQLRLGEGVTGPIALPPTLCITVATRQSRDEVLHLVDPETRMIAAVGHLSGGLVTGNSGEAYRMLVGGVTSLTADMMSMI